MAMWSAKTSVFAAFVFVAVNSVLAPVWTPQTSGFAGRLRGVSAATEKVAWASGTGGTVLRTEDGGATWKKLALPEDPALARIDFRDIDAIDARTAYVLSIPASNNVSPSRIYKTTDAGVTWTLQFKDDEPNGFYDAMAFWDADHGVVMGDSIGGQFRILITDNGGRTWTKVPQSALPPALPNEGAFAGSGTNVTVLGKTDAWIGTGAGPKCRVLRTADRGKSWTVAETPIAATGSAGIFSVAFRDRNHGVVVGGDYSKEKEAVDNVATTSDGGRTWTLVKDRGLSGFRSVVKYVPGTKMSLVAVGPQGADTSEDDGRTWTPLASPAPIPGFDTLSFAPGKNTGWASGARGALAKLVVR
jgi:photosystem II stability/assembly factor-like uncharacterized protein